MALRRLTLLLAGLLLVDALGNSAADKQWMSWLDHPPAAAVNVTDELLLRGRSIATDLLASGGSLHANGTMDYVCSGGGNLDFYFVGIYSVLASLQDQRPDLIHLLRGAGASAGGMTPFEIALKTLPTTLTAHMAYGLLQEMFPSDFSNALSAAAEQDHHWRLMAHWMVQKYGASLKTLDGKIFLALSCLDPFPQLVIVSNYTSQGQAESAFMGTGTIYEWYDGMPCSDGGAESGPKMTPLFQDQARPQIIVDLMQTGAPSSMAFRYNVTEAVTLLKRGQDEAAEFLSTGTVARAAGAITVCAVGSDVKSNECKPK